MQNIHSLYFIYMPIFYLLLHLFVSLCHILHFDAAKFSIKLFSLIYFTVSRQWSEYEIVTEKQPIETITSSPSQDVNLHKNPDN